MLMEGLQLLVVGVAVVYLFLGALVLLLSALSRFAGKPKQQRGDSATAADRPSAQEVAAIVVAVTRRRPRG